MDLFPPEFAPLPAPDPASAGISLERQNIFANPAPIRYDERRRKSGVFSEGEVNTNHKDRNPTHAFYWEALGESRPDDVCQRTEAFYDEKERGYVLSILHRPYTVLPGERKILVRQSGALEEEKFRDNFFLMVLLYLLNAKGGQPGRDWVGEKELKGGTNFFRGPHALPVEEIRRAFGKDAAGFLRAGARLGGVEIPYGDKALALQVFPKVPLAYVLWQEDQEFPARVTVLFDATIQNHFSLDGVWCLVAEVSRRLLEAREP
jgi:hypothetical protein